MLHRLSNTIGFLIFFTLIGVSLLVYMGYYLTGLAEQIGGSSDFSLIGFDKTLPHWLIYVIGILLIGLNLWIIRKVNIKHRFTEGGTTPLVVFYLIYISFFPSLILELELVLSSSFCLLMLYIALAIYNQSSVMRLIFSSSILLGLASILYYPFALLIAIILVTISIFRSFEIREYLMAFIGFLLPFFYVYSIAYLANYKIPELDLSLLLFSYELASFSLGGVLLFLLSFLAFIHLFLFRSKLVVRQRNQLHIMMLFTLIIFLAIFFIPNQGPIILLAAPLSLCFYVLYQNFSKKWLLDLYLLALFVSSIVEKINS